MIFDRPYLLLTPGPLSTTPTVRQAMGRDWCTWDADYNEGVVSDVRRRVELLASPSRPDAVTSTLIQGSGTAAVEATVGSSVPTDGHLLVLANGHYGQRIGRIAEILGIRSTDYDVGELGRFDPAVLRSIIVGDSSITHMAVVHCETTTGRLNDIAPIWPECFVARIGPSPGLQYFRWTSSINGPRWRLSTVSGGSRPPLMWLGRFTKR